MYSVASSWFNVSLFKEALNIIACLISFPVILLVEFLSQLSIAILMPWLGHRLIDLLELIFTLSGRGYMVEL